MQYLYCWPYQWVTRRLFYKQHLCSPRFFIGGVRVAHLLVFCVLCCFGPVSVVPNVASVPGLSVLDCPFRFSLRFICPVSCVPNVVSVSGLSILDRPFRFSLRFICPVSCVPNVASVSGLSTLDCPFRFSLPFIQLTNGRS